ncbi:MAG: rRNA maturation RNase YbeY [Planctomycetes bacterium]|nr:rRNA maturation RNase YbeY [Planctomycetota bacterium]
MDTIDRCGRGDDVVFDVEIANRQQVMRVDTAWLRRVTSRALAAIGEPRATIAVAVVDDRRIAALHVRWLGIPGPTDVLTFDLATAPGELTGDIAVSAETARRTARSLGWQARYELAYYVVHGLLHLAGERDGTPGERRRMRRRERVVMVSAGLPVPPCRPRSPARHAR